MVRGVDSPVHLFFDLAFQRQFTPSDKWTKAQRPAKPAVAAHTRQDIDRKRSPYQLGRLICSGPEPLGGARVLVSLHGPFHGRALDMLRSEILCDHNGV